MACNCGRTDCIQCLIERSTTIDPPPDFTMPQLDAIILVVRPIPPSTEKERNARQEAMTSLFHHLQSLTLLCSDLKLTASLNSKKST